MAEGILRHYGSRHFEVASAGVHPSQVDPVAIHVMHEIGIDISGQRSKHISEFLNHPFDYVITVCDYAKEICPIFNAKLKQIHWSFPDPPHHQGMSQHVISEFRKVRDMILQKFKLVGETGKI